MKPYFKAQAQIMCIKAEWKFKITIFGVNRALSLILSLTVYNLLYDLEQMNLAFLSHSLFINKA